MLCPQSFLSYSLPLTKRLVPPSQAKSSEDALHASITSLTQSSQRKDAELAEAIAALAQSAQGKHTELTERHQALTIQLQQTRTTVSAKVHGPPPPPGVGFCIGWKR